MRVPVSESRLLRIDVQNEVIVVTHHSKRANLDCEHVAQLRKPIDDPLLAMRVVLPGVLIEAPKPCTSNASCDDMVVGRVLKTHECLARVGHGLRSEEEGSLSSVEGTRSVDMCQSHPEMHGCPRSVRAFYRSGASCS